MPRNMSFAMTTPQIRARTKTVTRRFSWWFLKPGDVLWAAEKCMGFQKGEKIQRLCRIKVVSVKGGTAGCYQYGGCCPGGVSRLDS